MKTGCGTGRRRSANETSGLQTPSVYQPAEDAETIVRRIDGLAPAIGADTGRLLEWCAAFAGMTALEIAEASADLASQLQPLFALAAGV